MPLTSNFERIFIWGLEGKIPAGINHDWHQLTSLSWNPFYGDHQGQPGTILRDWQIYEGPIDFNWHFPILTAHTSVATLFVLKFFFGKSRFSFLLMACWVLRGGRARIFEMVSHSQMVSWMISGNSWAISDHLLDDTKFLRIAATANSHSFSLWLSCSSYNQPHCLAYV